MGKDYRNRRIRNSICQYGSEALQSRNQILKSREQFSERICKLGAGCKAESRNDVYLFYVCKDRNEADGRRWRRKAEDQIH